MSTINYSIFDYSLLCMELITSDMVSIHIDHFPTNTHFINRELVENISLDICLTLT